MRPLTESEMAVETTDGHRALVRGDGQVTLDLGRRDGGARGPGIGRIRPDPIVGFRWLARPPKERVLRARTLKRAVGLLVRKHLRGRAS